MPQPAAPRRSRGLSRVLRYAMLGAAAALVLVLALLIALYLARREAAREVLTGWLERRGVEAEIEIERIDLDGFIGRIRAGPEDNPDFSAHRVEVDYAVGWPWSEGGLGVTPSRIRLVRPVVRATWRDGELSFGSLDRVIDEFMARPPRPDARGPHVVIEEGRLRLTTDYGLVTAGADARLDDNRLLALDAELPRTVLDGESFDLAVDSLRLSLRTAGDRIKADLRAVAPEAAWGDAAAEGAVLTLTGDLPYPDLEHRRGDGRAVVSGALTADQLRSGETEARGFDAEFGFDGQTSGWIEAFRIVGDLRSTTTAERVRSPAFAAGAASVSTGAARVSIDRDADGLEWRVEGPAAVRAASASTAGVEFSGLVARTSRLLAGGRGGALEAGAPLALSADRVGMGDLDLAGVRGRLEADLRMSGPLLLTLEGALSSTHGRWPVLGQPKADDAPELAGLKTALSDFTFAAPGLRITAGTPGAEVRLTRPATLSPANGGAVTLTPRSDAVLFTARAGGEGGGGLDLAASGGALPEASIAIPRWRLTDGGFNADLAGRAALDFDFIRGAALETEGQLAMAGGSLTFAPSACVPVSVDSFELGENDILGVAGQLCSASGPLLTVRDGGWTLDATVREGEALAPFLQMAFAGIDGPLRVNGGEAGVGLEATIAAARIGDTADPARFHPLTAAGDASLVGENWSGLFTLSSEGRRLGVVGLKHNGLSATGGVTIDATNLAFAEGGLQPTDLTPLAERLSDGPITGSASFTGSFNWGPEEASSYGLFATPGLNFASPAGMVTGLAGEVEFISLAPLASAPDQRLTIANVEALTPLSDLELVFELTPEAVHLSAADVTAAGGRVHIEPFSVPLDPTEPYEGVLVFENVQLGALLPETGIGEQVALDAVVSGRLPFTSDPENGFQIVGGYLQATEPGRLSINRTALAGVDAGGGGEALPPNTVQDFAYQAMENLAFDLLDAEVNSLPEGRLGVVFHIRGRHDPPQHQEIRLTVQELLSRSFLNRVLPLPSGTGIDLTLDATLNLDQLLADLAAMNRARRGLPEQPDGD